LSYGAILFLPISLAAQSPTNLDPRFTADAHRLKTGTFVYRNVDEGHDVGRSRITIRAIPGSGTFLFSNEVTGKFSQRWESIASPRFEPISAKLIFGEGSAARPSFELTYKSGRVTGFAVPRRSSGVLQSVDDAIPARTVDQRIDWAAVLASEYAPGREFEFNVYDPAIGISRVKVKIGAMEHVKVPAGSFDAYRITYRIEKATGAETYEVLASKDHVLVREDFPNGSRTELAEILFGE
jgi:hypothetical protein